MTLIDTKVLVDTNILLRMADLGSEQGKVAVAATGMLHDEGEELCVAPQNLYEYWAAATRPKANNGLGQSRQEAEQNLREIMDLYRVLDETRRTPDEWLRLIVAYDVKGKPTHDAHLVATMLVNGIGKILTFNTGDFARFAEVQVLDPVGCANERYP